MSRAALLDPWPAVVRGYRDFGKIAMPRFAQAATTPEPHYDPSLR